MHLYLKVTDYNYTRTCRLQLQFQLYLVSNSSQQLCRPPTTAKLPKVTVTVTPEESPDDDDAPPLPPLGGCAESGVTRRGATTVRTAGLCCTRAEAGTPDGT